MTQTFETSNTTRPFDQARADAFVGKVVGDTVGLATTAMASIGDRLGLFKDLAGRGPSTSAELAARTRTHERYVREWLGGVVTAGFVQYVADDHTYSLRPDHAPFLTGTGADNLARTMRFVSLMGMVQPKVIDAFRNGGGLSYDDYPDFHHLQAADSAATA